jgi:carbon-monoxide dehydrogenase medium subunit
MEQTLPQALRQAAHLLASPSIRNTATIGGNVCNASPAADLSIALLALNSEALIRNSSGEERRTPLQSFYMGPGITCLKQNEFLKGLFIPYTHTFSCFMKLGVRAVMEIAIVSCAVALEMNGKIVTNCRISLGSMGPIPYCCESAGETMHDLDLCDPAYQKKIARAATIAKETSRPISDMRASGEYRSAMAEVLVQRSLEEACRQASPGHDSSKQAAP